jgi:hypothetical protein
VAALVIHHLRDLKPYFSIILHNDEHKFAVSPSKSGKGCFDGFSIGGMIKAPVVWPGGDGLDVKVGRGVFALVWKVGIGGWSK